MRTEFILLFEIFIFVHAHRQFSKRNTDASSEEVMNFMKRFGYLPADRDDKPAELLSKDGLAEALKSVQKYGAIEETGILDDATLRLMKSPRCGNSDILKNKRTKRYTLVGQGWNKRHLTFYIANWPPSLTENIVSNYIEKALNTWGTYGNLSFAKASTPEADIIVSFSSGNHFDGASFDGRGGTLAHAYYPVDGSDIGGDIHFDADENWVDGLSSEMFDGPDLYTVALHELGHSLGLAHSADPGSIMFPYYRGGNSLSVQLGNDDIMAMYELYIKRNIKEDPSRNMPTISWYPNTKPTAFFRPTEPTTSNYHKYTNDYTSTTFKTIVETWSPRTTLRTSRFPTRYTPTKPCSCKKTSVSKTCQTHYSTTSPSIYKTTQTGTENIPDICAGSFDAISILRGQLFVFKGNYIWRYSDIGHLIQGYPLQLRDMFQGLPKRVKKIDAIYERPDGNMVLFTGDVYGVFDGRSFVEGTPRPISDYGVPVGIGGIDAITTWQKNKKTYLFKGSKFWRYDETTKMPDPGYPSHIEQWRGVPSYLDDAMTWIDGKTYFFKRDKFWEIDNEVVGITDDSPKPVGQWVGC